MGEAGAVEKKQKTGEKKRDRITTGNYEVSGWQQAFSPSC